MRSPKRLCFKIGSIDNLKSLELTLSSEYFVNNENLRPREHAKRLDRILGYKVSKTEEKLLQKYVAYNCSIDISNKKQHYEGTQAWVGLDPQVLQTPYCHIYEALAFLIGHKIEHVVDIGAGYGRVGIVLNTLFPQAMFTGYEVVKRRQFEGNKVLKKLNLTNAKIYRVNVLDIGFELPAADVYFLYDFSEQEDISFILNLISHCVKKRKIWLVVKGDRVTYLMRNCFRQYWHSEKKFKDSGIEILSFKKLTGGLNV